jgi:uncharacterized protein
MAASAYCLSPATIPLPNLESFDMKKKPVSAQETPKPIVAKPKPAQTKPLLDSAIAVARKILKPQSKKVADPETEVDAATVVRRTYTKNKKSEADAPDVPAILLEGDAPAPVPVSGPGEKFSLGAIPPAQNFSGGELPESYGTKKLFLTARDPHWLYAHWDLTRSQQLELNSASTDGHLVLRIFAGKIEGHPAYEIHVHPESRHWFAHVERAGNSYAAELGYYSALGKWMRVAVSSGTVTPPDAVSREDDAEFATIPFEFPFARLMQIIEDAVHDNIPLAQAIEELRRSGHPDLPRFTAASLAIPAPRPSWAWTPQQEQALAKVINIDQTRRIWMGSLEITELIRRRLSQDVSSPSSAFGISSFGLSSPTSPFGGESEQAKSFWFNVNAELIIYGATEPDAKVTLGGHEIKLRSDGTFSYRFALPDGVYDLPAVAVSAGGDDARAADLKFSRATQLLGDVGTHPQDPSLKPPLPESL